MATQSNPRKLYQSGGAIVVSIPSEIMTELGVEKGDRVVLEADSGSGTIQPVEWTVSDA